LADDHTEIAGLWRFRVPRGGDGPAPSMRFRARLNCLPAWVGRLNQGSNLLNLCPHDPTDSFGLARVKPELEIAVAVAPRTARAISPAVHPAPAPSPYSRLPAGVTGAGLGPTSESFRHIREPTLNVRLTHGVEFHF
jgi:hypothetical protein